MKTMGTATFGMLGASVAAERESNLAFSSSILSNFPRFANPTPPPRLGAERRSTVFCAVSRRPRGSPSRKPRPNGSSARGINVGASDSRRPHADLGAAERLQKVMSRLGVASRRASEELIAEGKVRVNGRVVRDRGVLVDARRDRIAVDGRNVEPPQRAVWVAVHKPRGFLSLPKEGYRRTIASLIPRSQCRNLVAVGGIEEDFSGLVLMTNERGHVPHLSSPDNRHVKEWVVDCEGIVSDNKVAPLRRGVNLKGETTSTQPADIRIIGSGKVELSAKESKVMMTRIEVRLRESRHHLIRRLFESADLTVLRASRKSFGPVLLGSLKRGDFRYLTANEVKALKRGVSSGKK